MGALGLVGASISMSLPYARNGIGSKSDFSLNVQTKFECSVQQL